MVTKRTVLLLLLGMLVAMALTSVAFANGHARGEVPSVTTEAPEVAPPAPRPRPPKRRPARLRCRPARRRWVSSPALPTSRSPWR